MKYEVIETVGAWVVQHNGVELQRFELQEDALAHVAGRLRGVDPGDHSVSLSVRFAQKG